MYTLFTHSVNINAESPDPSSSWRSLIPVIKLNISTVSTTHTVNASRASPFGLWSLLWGRKREHNKMKILFSILLPPPFCRDIWHLAITIYPRPCVWTLKMLFWLTPPSLHPATSTNSCTLSKARLKMSASCWFPVHATWACRTMSKYTTHLLKSNKNWVRDLNSDCVSC